MVSFYDTLLGEYIKNPWERWMWLDALSEQYFDYKMISYNEITDNKKLSFIDVNLEKAAIYSWEDVYMTNKLYERQKEDDLWDRQKDLLEQTDVPFIQVLKDIELTWVYIDKEILDEIWKKLLIEIERLKQEIITESWEEININSPKQVWELLFDRLWLPTWKKTKTWWSVSAEVLENLSSEYPIAQMIVDYRHFSKIHSTYVIWLGNMVNSSPKSLLHTNYNQAVTSTGRLSSTKPNLQNIPSSWGLAWEIRKAFVSRFDWWTIMAFDYSQIELRLLAIMSSDIKLLEAFKQWKDIHDATAIMLWWVERKIAKAVNFGVVYWISWFGLSKMMNVSVSDGNIYIKKFYEEYSWVKTYFEKIIKDCEVNWYVETLFWRRRYIKWITDRNKMIKSWAEREAINMPIQWSNSDIMKIAMLKIQKVLEDNYKSKMIMQVHDELVFDAYPWEEKSLRILVTEIMENILTDIPINLKVDCESWNSWKDCK